MPTALYPIPTTYQSITRHAVFSVVTDVLHHMNIHTDVPVRYPGLTGQVFQNGSTINRDPQVVFDQVSKVSVEVKEQQQEGTELSMSVFHPEHRAVFTDAALRVLLKPVYAQTQATISFTYRAATAAEAEHWLEDYITRTALGREQLLHHLDYHYPVPSEALLVLHHLHSLREAQAGYGEDLHQYLKDHFTQDATSLTNPAGTEALLVIRERQEFVQGLFDFSTPPEPEKTPDGSTWIIRFDYRFSYQKAVKMAFRYPLVVHNQLIDDIYYSTCPAWRSAWDVLNDSVGRTAFANIAPIPQRPKDPMGGVRTPAFDDWVPRSVPTYTTTLATWLLQVDPADPTLLLDLKDLGEHILHPTFEAWLREVEYPYLGQRGESLVYLHLFRGEEPVDIPVVVDADLIVRSAEPLELREVYHLRLGVITEFSLLTERALESMMAHPRVTILIFQSLENRLDVEHAWSITIGRPERLPRSYIDWFAEYLRGHAMGVNPFFDKTYHVDWPLVGFLTIIASREE